MALYRLSTAKIMFEALQMCVGQHKKQIAGKWTDWTVSYLEVLSYWAPSGAIEHLVVLIISSYALLWFLLQTMTQLCKTL